MERRHSTDSSDSSNCSRQSAEDVPPQGRVSKTTSPKPPSNALQFVKTGPCDLYRKAQEQLKKAQEVKKETRNIRHDTEEWQSNLDNWKSSRRKMQEHIIERVVEVKKLEMEEHERSRRRNKTFNEMMQDRSNRGRKISSIPVYDDDSANDLSGLGISPTSEKNDHSSLEETSSSESETQVVKDCSSLKKTEATLSTKTSSITKSMTSDETEKSFTKSNEKEEYTYERAIQNYVNFAETRVKSKSAKSIPDQIKSETLKEDERQHPSIPVKPNLSSKSPLRSKLESYRRSISTNDITESKKVLPNVKIDINKRRELFEKHEMEESGNKNKIVANVDLSSAKSIRDRLKSLEKEMESSRTRQSERRSSDVSVRERLNSIESLSQNGHKSPEAHNNVKNIKLNGIDKIKEIEPSKTIEERLSSLQASCQKDVPKTVIPKSDSVFKEKLNTFQDIEINSATNYALSNSERFDYSGSIFDAKKQRHFRHRSLDSLDIDDSSVQNVTFERVQSFEDLEYCRNYAPSSISCDTDREDSGIHTADVSSSVSQADDFDIHLDGAITDDMKLNHQQPTIAEELNQADACDDDKDVSCELDSEPIPLPRTLPKLDSCTSPLPAILENPAESVDHPTVHTPQPDSSQQPLSNGQEQSSGFITDGVKCSVEETPLDTHYLSIDNPPSTSIEKLDCLEENSTNCSPKLEESINLIDDKVDQLELGLDVSENLECDNVSDKMEPISFEDDLLVLETNDEPEKPTVAVEAHQYVTSLQNNLQQVHPQPLKIEEITVETSPHQEPTTVFPLSPSALEPPKEKPPPPPLELTDEDADSKEKSSSIRRLDSTKRIKKEIWQKRSSFLGLEGNEENYVDPVELARPPDLTTLLAEERTLERQLYRQSLCSETDSNQESRDSGVELDNKPIENWHHSRNNSDNFGNHSTTSDEDEIVKKEREIIETLEKEERLRKQQLGEKLAMRLRELEVEKNNLEWESYGKEPGDNMILLERNQNIMNHVNGDVNDDMDRFCSKDVEGLGQQPYVNGGKMWYEQQSDVETAFSDPEIPPSIIHKQPEQSTFNYIPPITYRTYQNVEVGHRAVNPPPIHGKSYMDLTSNGFINSSKVNPLHRRSMPDLQQPNGEVLRNEMNQKGVEHLPRVRPPPPPLPTKPHHLSSQQTSCQMSRQTLQALSAAPKPRLISNESWQAKRRPKQENCNYQHWIIQEAELRRIAELQKRRQEAENDWSQGAQWPPTAHKPVYTSTPAPPSWTSRRGDKPLPDSIIQTLTQRVQRKADTNNNRKRFENNDNMQRDPILRDSSQEKVLSVSGKKRCSACGDELGRGAAMIIESLQLFYHIACFKCCVCFQQLGDGLMGADVRVRNNKLHCHNCYSSDDGVKFSCV